NNPRIISRLPPHPAPPPKKCLTCEVLAVIRFHSTGNSRWHGVTGYTRVWRSGWLEDGFL
ncbi:hypothetical protein DPEC_G00015740, partial [Dallia pectoralis]